MSGVTAIEAPTRELQLLDEELMRCVRLRDARRLVETLYAPDAQIHAAGRPPVQGTGALLDFWILSFRDGLVDAKFETSQFEMEHELACGIGRYSFTLERHPGILHTEKGKFVSVYRRQADGRWRALICSLSANG